MKWNIPLTAIAPTGLSRSRFFLLVTAGQMGCALWVFAFSFPVRGDDLSDAARNALHHETATLSSANGVPLTKPDMVLLSNSSAAFNVLANDSDPNNDRLFLVSATASFGAVIFTQEGLMAYAQEPGRQPREDIVTYTATDRRGGFSVGSVRILID